MTFFCRPEFLIESFVESDVVVRMIGLNAESSVQEVDLGSQIWKVLVYDDLGQNILSTLLNVRDMRKLGVTLFM